MIVSPIRSGHRGRPRNRVVIGRLSQVDTWTNVLRFSPLDKDLFPDQCFIVAANDLISNRFRHLISFHSSDIFSVTFNGFSQHLPFGVAYVVSNVVCLGNIGGLSE